ncbi:MAG: L-threonylcarbamoyladenylate synthase [Acutalibacteraceae bacterium]|jgi:L-threonylcarbamoyladenylate synthase
MQTQLFKINSNNDNDKISRAGEILKNGGVVGIPTETVYGLAANALDENAVAKIFRAKGRPSDNPLIVHIADFDDIYKLASDVPKEAVLLANKFWPGPLTIILKSLDIVPKSVSAGLGTVAIRMPSHEVARQIIRSAGVPLAAPSANLSGTPSPTTAQHVMDDLNGRIDAVVDGGVCSVGLESTVITLCTSPPRLLRPGKITPNELSCVIGEIEIDNSVLDKLDNNVSPSSPGMKYKHYSPKANVIIIRGELKNFIDFVSLHKKSGVMALCFDGEENNMPVPSLCFGQKSNAQEQAHNLFNALREIDSLGASTVYVRSPKSDGIGLAVFNRLLRAAEFEVIDV